MNVESFSIGELCSSVSERYTENLPYVRLVNTSDILEGELLPLEKVKNENLKGQFKKAFKNGDILFSEIRPANRRFAFIENENTKELIASTKLMVIRANKDKVIPKYLYYFLTSQNILNKLQNLAETRSGTFPQITFSGEIAPISIKLPNIAEQNHIVNFIDAINSKILINKKINKNLEAQANSIFFNKCIAKKSIPLNWEKGNLTDIANFTNGLAMQKFRPKKNEIGIPVLKIAELRQGRCDKNSDLCSPSIDSNYIVHDGDVIFSWSGSLIVDFWTGGKCGLNQHLFNVNSSHFEKWFYYSWTKYYLNKFISIASDKATTMGHIKREDLTKAEVLIPSVNDYTSIGNEVSPLYELLISNRIQNRQLELLRDNLLPKIVTGQLDLSDLKIKL